MEIKKTLKHAYEVPVLYELCWGHSTAHVALEVSTMQQLLDKTMTKRRDVSIMEMGAGPSSRYKNLWATLAPDNTDITFKKFLINDAATADWDYGQAAPGELHASVDVVLMPYYLVTSLVNWGRWTPFNRKQMVNLFGQIHKVLKPGGRVLVHNPNNRPSELPKKPEPNEAFAKVPFRLVRDLNLFFSTPECPVNLKYEGLTCTSYRSDETIVLPDGTFTCDTCTHQVIEGFLYNGEPFKAVIKYTKSKMWQRQGEVLDFAVAGGFDRSKARQYLAEQEPGYDCLTEDQKLGAKSGTHQWFVFEK